MSAPKTHALVIGTSYYDILPSAPETVAGHETFRLSQLDCAATGAFIFYEWLKNSESGYKNPIAPIGSCELVISPSEIETKQRPDMKSGFKPATTKNVRRSLLKWWKKCGENPQNVAVLYVSGHGIQTRDFDQLVLLQDFASDELVLSYAIDINGIHKGMVGRSMASTQFYFVDACRNEAPGIGNYHYGHALTLPRVYAGADLRVAPIYYSASPGTAALGEVGKGTLFSQALMKSLSINGSTSGQIFKDLEQPKVITTSSLLESLEREMTKLQVGRATGQTVVIQGLVKSGVVTYLEDSTIPGEQLSLMKTESPNVEVSKKIFALDKAEVRSKRSIPMASTGAPSTYAQNNSSLGRPEPLEVVQDSRYIGRVDSRDWWVWSVRIKASFDVLLAIRQVEYSLHDSFKEPNVVVEDSNRNFMLERTGWGGFSMGIVIVYKSGQRSSLEHELQLLYPGGKKCLK